MDLCHVPASQRHQVDGTSFANVLHGNDGEIHDYLFFEIGATRAVLKDGWKYLAFRLQTRFYKILPSHTRISQTVLVDEVLKDLRRISIQTTTTPINSMTSGAIRWNETIA